MKRKALQRARLRQASWHATSVITPAAKLPSPSSRLLAPCSGQQLRRSLRIHAKLGNLGIGGDSGKGEGGGSGACGGGGDGVWNVLGRGFEMMGEECELCEVGRASVDGCVPEYEEAVR